MECTLDWLGGFQRVLDCFIRKGLVYVTNTEHSEIQCLTLIGVLNIRQVIKVLI